MEIGARRSRRFIAQDKREPEISRIPGWRMMKRAEAPRSVIHFCEAHQCRLLQRIKIESIERWN
jgi:hypothetical protein